MISDSDKYKIYRKRFLEDFILPGTEQGCSIPANQRSDTEITFGDGTVYLGWYLAVLATEKNLDYERIDDALNSLERLMESCGYFIRDDVAEFKGLKVHSDFLGANIHMKEESQDQAIHLLMGLMFMHRSLSNVKNRLIKVEDLIERIIGWIAENHWTIRNPETGKAVARGPYAHAFSYPMSLVYSGVRKKVWWIFKFIWKYIMHYFIPRIYTTTNLHLVSTMAAISNGWGERTVKYLLKFAKINNWYIYPMINAVLYPSRKKGAELEGWEYNICEMLFFAPEEGPNYDSPSSWRVAHLFLTEKERQWGTGPPWAKGMRFSGLDFMLMYNLYLKLNVDIFPNATPADGGDVKQASSDSLEF